MGLKPHYLFQEIVEMQNSKMLSNIIKIEALLLGLSVVLLSIFLLITSPFSFLIKMILTGVSLFIIVMSIRAIQSQKILSTAAILVAIFAFLVLGLGLGIPLFQLQQTTRLSVFEASFLFISLALSVFNTCLLGVVLISSLHKKS